MLPLFSVVSALASGDDCCNPSADQAVTEDRSDGNGLIDRFNNSMNYRESVLEARALTVLKLNVVTG